jgi:hypothetical protein
MTACRGTDGSTTVTDTTGQGRSLLMVIRADGVIVDGYGRLPCCPPSKYFFKERQFIPQPTAPIEPSLCPFIKCGPCPEMRINMTTPDVTAHPRVSPACLRMQGRAHWYRKGRDQSGPKQMLEGYAGILQVDGYAVYEKFFGNHSDILLVYCMAHARRNRGGGPLCRRYEIR